MTATMKRVACACAVTALVMLASIERAEAFKVEYEAGLDGFSLSYRFFPFLGSGKVYLAGPDTPHQNINLRFFFIRFAVLVLSIKAIAPDDKSKLTLHYNISSNLFTFLKSAGDISLPFGHGGASNSLFYRAEDRAYDMEGVLQVKRRRSRYALNFGLGNLNGMWEAQADPDNKTIQQVITRDNGLQFADINLTFTPQLFTSKIAFSIAITPLSAALPDDIFTLAGSLSVPYGIYHFWFYRDSVN
jgi:hypothetical protein